MPKTRFSLVSTPHPETEVVSVSAWDSTFLTCSNWGRLQPITTRLQTFTTTSIGSPRTPHSVVWGKECHSSQTGWGLVRGSIQDCSIRLLLTLLGRIAQR